MLQHAYLQAATRLDPELFTHALSAARSSTPKAVPYSLPISSETIVCIWSSVLFCGLYIPLPHPGGATCVRYLLPVVMPSP